MSPYRDVLAFMKIGQPASCPDTLQSLAAEEMLQHELIAAGRACGAYALAFTPTAHPLALRSRLMLEELGEVLVAMGEGNMEEVADGLVDLEYVTVGAAITLGIPHEKCWEEVQRANLAKYPDGHVLRDAQGKVQKPPGWTPPDIKGVLARFSKSQP